VAGGGVQAIAKELLLGSYVAERGQPSESPGRRGGVPPEGGGGNIGVLKKRNCREGGDNCDTGDLEKKKGGSGDALEGNIGKSSRKIDYIKIKQQRNPSRKGARRKRERG